MPAMLDVGARIDKNHAKSRTGLLATHAARGAPLSQDFDRARRHFHG
jgi:hypothetical protein